MSLANAKTEKGTPSTAAAGATSAVAVVQPTPATQGTQAHGGEQILPKDLNHGRGGIYTVVNGVRQRVSGTAQTPVKKD